MTDWTAHYEAQAQAAEEEAQEAHLHPRRTPLTANQHILHLLLTVVTGGIWGIVWIVRAIQGNRA